MDQQDADGSPGQRISGDAYLRHCGFFVETGEWPGIRHSSPVQRDRSFLLYSPGLPLSMPWASVFRRTGSVGNIMRCRTNHESLRNIIEYEPPRNPGE